MNFQDWLTQQMKSYDLNQTGLALKLGVSQSVVSSWLRGLYTPSPENCRKLAQLFHVAPEDIFKLVGYMENTVNLPFPLPPTATPAAPPSYAPPPPTPPPAAAASHSPPTETLAQRPSQLTPPSFRETPAHAHQ